MALLNIFKQLTTTTKGLTLGIKMGAKVYRT